MNQVDILLHIEQALQTKGFLLYSDLDKEEVNLQLDYAFSDLIDEVLKEERNKGVESVQYKLDLLRVLKKEELLQEDSALTSSFGEGKVYTLPEDYSDYIRFKADTIYRNTEFKGQKVRVAQDEIVDILKEDTFYKSKYYNLLSYITNNKIYVYKNSDFDINNVKISYIKKYTPIDVNLDIDYVAPKKMIFAIIDIAVKRLSVIMEQNPNKVQQL